MPAGRAHGVTGAPHPVLPPAGVDLATLAATPIPGPRAPGWPGREADLAAHVARLRPEFGDTSEAAHLLAATIVVMRRDPADSHAAALFRRLTAEHGGDLAPQLSLRWLISVCDTVADLPSATLAERSLAMLAAALANTVKLAETERRLYHPPRPWPPRRRFAVGHEMFDGLKAFWPGRGDMVENLADRIAALIDQAQAEGLAVAPFAGEVMIRLMSPDTVFGRFEMIRGGKKLPLVDDEVRAGLQALMRRL